MKNIKYLMIFTVGVILTIGIGNAYKLNASEVTYDKKNTTLESNTVSGAVNELGVLATTSMSELKNKIELVLTKLDDIKSDSSENYQSGYEDGYNAAIETNKPVVIKTVTGTSTIGVAAYEGWQNLTVDNFIIEVKSLSVGAYSRNSAHEDGSSATITPYFTKSYDPSTGILTVTLQKSAAEQSSTNGWSRTSVSASVSANVYLVR